MPKRKRRLTFDDTNSDYSSEDLLEDTTEKERTHVIELCTRIGRYCCGFLIATSILSALLVVQLLLGAESLFWSELKNVFPVTIGFIGAVNVVSGLLLLGKE